MDIFSSESLTAIGIIATAFGSYYTYRQFKLSNSPRKMAPTPNPPATHNNSNDSKINSNNVINLQISPYKRDLLSSLEALYDKYGDILEKFIEKQLEHDVLKDSFNFDISLSGKTYAIPYYMSYQPDFFNHNAIKNWKKDIVDDFKSGLLSFVANLDQLHQSYGENKPGIQLEYKNKYKQGGKFGIDFIEYTSGSRDIFEGYLITDYFAHKDFRISWLLREHFKIIFEIIKNDIYLIKKIKDNTLYILDADCLAQVFEELEERKIVKQLIYFTILSQDHLLINEVYKRSLKNFNYKTFRRHS